jgi:RimJ/RimL family protein N-acetyltransferase
MYRSYGFGLNRVALAADDRAIGICGILRRETLADADLGFALLPEYRGQGYALEAAGAVLEHARTALGIGRLAAIVDPDNVGSIRLLKKLGFRRAGEYCADRSPRAHELYNVDLDAPRDSGPLESQDIVDVIEA